MDRLLDASNQELQKENEKLTGKLNDAAETISRYQLFMFASSIMVIMLGIYAISTAFPGSYEQSLEWAQDSAKFWERSSNFWKAIKDHKVSVIERQDDEIDKLKHERDELIKWNKEWAAKAILCKIWGPAHDKKVSKEKVAEMLKQELDATNLSIQVP